MFVGTIQVATMTKEQYRKFFRLNLGDAGLMKYYLKSAFEKESSRLKLRRNETIIYVSEGDQIVSWVLLLEFRSCYACRWKRGIHIYTRASCRRQGYADILIKESIARTTPKRLYCRGNTKFFSRYGIKYA